MLNNPQDSKLGMKNCTPNKTNCDFAMEWMKFIPVTTNTLDILSWDIIKIIFQYLDATARLHLASALGKTSYLTTAYQIIFHDCSVLTLDENWGNISTDIVTMCLASMMTLHNITILSSYFETANEPKLVDLAALVYINRNTLRSLNIQSPRFVRNDRMQVGQIYSLSPTIFPRLYSLKFSGCQSMGWLHVFSNCYFPRVANFEVCFFPEAHDHWSWQTCLDCTPLGVRGIHRIIDTMILLERLVIGLDIWIECGHSDPPPGALKLELQNNNCENNDDRLNLQSSMESQASISSERRQLSTMSTSTSLGESHGSFQEHASYQKAPNNHKVNINGSIYNLNECMSKKGRSRKLLDQKAIASYSAQHELNHPEDPQPFGGISRFRSWRGRISEVDFGDIFVIALARGAYSGRLKHITLRSRHETADKTEETPFIADLLSRTFRAGRQWVSSLVDVNEN